MEHLNIFLRKWKTIYLLAYNSLETVNKIFFMKHLEKCSFGQQQKKTLTYF